MTGITKNTDLVVYGSVHSSHITRSSEYPTLLFLSEDFIYATFESRCLFPGAWAQMHHIMLNAFDMNSHFWHQDWLLPVLSVWMLQWCQCGLSGFHNNPFPWHSHLLSGAAHAEADSLSPQCFIKSAPN